MKVDDLRAFQLQSMVFNDQQKPECEALEKEAIDER